MRRQRRQAESPRVLSQEEVLERALRDLGDPDGDPDPDDSVN